MADFMLWEMAEEEGFAQPQPADSTQLVDFPICMICKIGIKWTTLAALTCKLATVIPGPVSLPSN